MFLYLAKSDGRPLSIYTYNDLSIYTYNDLCRNYLQIVHRNITIKVILSLLCFVATITNIAQEFSGYVLL